MRCYAWAFGAFMFVGSANAAVLLECDDSAGVMYALEGGILPPGQSSQAWDPDGISNGGISLIQDGDSFDIVISDATGSTFSARADGARIVAVEKGPNEWVLIVVYPNQVIETYQFAKLSNGGEVVWTQHKFGEMPIKKVGAYRAACSTKQ